MRLKFYMRKDANTNLLLQPKAACEAKLNTQTHTHTHIENKAKAIIEYNEDDEKVVITCRTHTEGRWGETG